MKHRSGLAVAVILFVSTSATAMAATATPDEAKRLTDLFQSYLGQLPGVITVEPAGAAYGVTFDFAPLLAKAPSSAFAASITPLKMQITDQGGGKWLVTQDQPFSLTAKVPGAFDITMKVGSIRSSSVFDEAIAAFASSTADYSDISGEQTTMAPDSGQSHAAYAIKTIHVESIMAAAADGIDGKLRAEIAGLAETISVPNAPDGSTPPMDINLTIAKMTQDTTIKGMKTKPVLGLISWFVAHPSPEAIKAAAGEITGLLRAGLPLFENLSGKGTIETLAVGSPFGLVGIAKASFGLTLNGIVKDGLLSESVSISGLTLPPGLVPPWAAKLVPDEFSIGFNVSGYDAAAASKLILDNLDFTADPPLKEEFQGPLLQALLPDGTVKISLEPSKVISQILSIGAEGSMTAGPAAPPSGQATVTAKGLDQVMEALQAAPAEMGLQQGITALVAAKGLAKQDADGNSIWKIESTPTGSVTINGIDPSKM